jgi:hypothetical protein
VDEAERLRSGLRPKPGGASVRLNEVAIVSSAMKARAAS